ncbi:hypothetical protein CDAR_463131 [Caerostris darwini]|uniref:Uncharacterized protein n=1 Tax=Caerostris darwini TaxID=1538125 RepID=A0AAV4Q7U5_9ARAC|nr:hypothetical protein CDAR_463131 [Caerostris darwini]
MWQLLAANKTFDVGLINGEPAILKGSAAQFEQRASVFERQGWPRKQDKKETQMSIENSVTMDTLVTDAANYIIVLLQMLAKTSLTRSNRDGERQKHMKSDVDIRALICVTPTADCKAR